MRNMHKHFYTNSGMFLMVAGVVGLSGIATTFSALMAPVPVAKPQILALQSGPFTQKISDGSQPLDVAVVGRTAQSITVKVITNANTAPLQFAFVPRVTLQADAPRTFSALDAATQAAAVYALHWSADDTFTFPVQSDMSGKWITIYAFAKDADESGLIPGLPNAIDAAGAIHFHVAE